MNLMSKSIRLQRRFLKLNQVRVWRLVGLVTSVVGLLYYALSPSFTHLIRGWNPLKIVLYGVLAFAIWAIILFAKQRPFSWQGKLTAFLGFVVFMPTNVYSFYFDKAMNEKPDVLSMVSNGAFAFTSLSFSKVFKFGFDLGIFSCFLTLLAAQLMTIHFMLIYVAIIFGIPLFIMHSSSDSLPKIDSREHHAIDIDPLSK